MALSDSSAKRPTHMPDGKFGSWGRFALICAVLIAVIFAVYLQVGTHDFLSFDDSSYVTKNPHVASGLTSENIVWAFTSTYSYNWHPITWLSHMADVSFFGLNPRGHHLVNVLIHAVSSLLLFLLLYRLTDSLWRSSFVAALFALHPMHVESVAWVAERKDVLSAFFCFLALLFYAEYAKNRSSVRYILSLACFVLGLMSKPMLVTLPLLMLLIDFWPLGRYPHDVGTNVARRAVALTIEKSPFFGCSLISGLITIYAQNRWGALSSFDILPLRLRIENSLTAYVKYVGKAFWPQGLAVYYPFPAAIPLWEVLGSLFMLILLSVAAVRYSRRHPPLLVGWFWFVITLLPVIGLIQVGAQSMADRYSYIPLIGIFIVAAWGVPDILQRLKQRRIVLAALYCLAIIASVALTWQQVGYWQNDITLCRRALEVTTDNYAIHNYLGVALTRKGELDAAILEYQQALRIKPNDAEAHQNLGVAFDRKGDLDAAIFEYRQALQIKPNLVQAYQNLMRALARKQLQVR